MDESGVRYRYSYSTKRRLGRGAFAEVFLGSARNPQAGADAPLHKVAVKRIEKARMQSSPKVNGMLKNEVTILRELRHPNVVRLLDSFENERYMHLVLEFCDGGDLGAYLKTNAPLSDAVAHDLFSQLVAGVRHVRDHSVVHRDIKPPNVLLHRDADRPSGFVAKLSDFGFACRLLTGDLAQTFVGSPLHMAPEVLSGSQYDPKIDLWSLGTILYQMATGTTPYRARSIAELKSKLQDTERQGQKLPMPLHTSVDLMDLVRRLLILDPRARIDFAELYAHPFVRTVPKPAEPLAFTAVGTSLAAEVGAGAASPLESVAVDQGSFVMVDRRVTEFAARLETLTGRTDDALADDARQVGLRNLADTAVRRAVLVLHVARDLGLWERLALHAFALMTLREVATQAREHLGAVERTGPSRRTVLAAFRFRDCMEHCLHTIDQLRSEAHRAGGAAESGAAAQRGVTELVTDGAAVLIDRAQRHAERGEVVPAESLYRDAIALLNVTLNRCRSPADRDRIGRYIESTERRLQACQEPDRAAHHIGLSLLATDSRMLEHRSPGASPTAPIAIPGGARPAAAAAAMRGPSSLGTSMFSVGSVGRARFCGACGLRFDLDTDVFCQMCGTQRGTIQSSHGSAPSSV